VKTYLERHALSTVTTDDLRQVFEELSGQPLDRFFDQWLYHARHPDLRVEYEWRPADKTARIVVRQTHATGDKVLTFAFDTAVRFVFDDGTSVERPVRVTGTSHEFTFALDRQPRIVRFDPRYGLLAKVDFPLPEEMHLAALDRADDVIGRVLAVKALERSRSRTAIERLGRALREDSFRGVREQAAGALAAIGTPEAREQLSSPGSLQQPDARVRRRVVEGVAAGYSPEVMRRLLAIAAAESNPAIRSVAIEGLAKYGQPEAREAILDALRSDSFRQEVAGAAMDAINATQDETLLAPLIRVVQSAPDRFPSRVLGTALRTAGRLGSLRDDPTSVREFIEPFLDDARPPVKIAALGALGDLGDRRAEPVLAGYARLGSADRVGKAAETALEALRTRQPFVPAEVKELRGEVRRLEEAQRRLLDKIDGLEKRIESRPPAPAGG